MGTPVPRQRPSPEALPLTADVALVLCEAPDHALLDRVDFFDQHCGVEKSCNVRMPSRAILGIDAAWTATQPSGVALVSRVDGRWSLIAAEASYSRFLSRADPSLAAEARPSGAAPNAPALLIASERLCGRPVDLVAIDMPLATTPIISRRAADNAISRLYGSRKCSTHTPSSIRPGQISDDLRAGFAAAGYPLRTSMATAPGLIEVYPHPALVELASAPERLPYKASKVRTYWRSSSPAERRARLLAQWSAIIALLDREIDGVADAIPLPAASASGIAMKAVEDMIDAVVCAWVGIMVLEGLAASHGDETAAIWVPTAR